ncbi:ferrous iron transport protein A [Ilyobacter sp.]|jgi:ferrous iron transport protein A|uniref:FeoA family protein n=1 Tax=Ilyobacter sp. TaxID=3100343 RepID=UPI00356310FA
MSHPVTYAQPNKRFVIKGINGNDKTKARLIERGFCIGENLCILRDDSENLIIEVNKSRYVVNFGLASKIMVDEA